MPPRIPLAQALRKAFFFRLNFIFGWQGWKYGPLDLVGKILYTCSCHFFFISWPLSELPLVVFATVFFVCLNWLLQLARLYHHINVFEEDASKIMFGHC